MKQDVSPAARPLDGVATALAVALCLSWGFNQVAIKLALPEIPPLIQAAGWIELILGALLMIGLFTRLVAFVLSGEMASAYFLGHMFKTGEPVLHPLNNGGTAAILFCFACLFISTAGGGPYSADAMMGKKA